MTRALARILLCCYLLWEAVSGNWFLVTVYSTRNDCERARAPHVQAQLKKGVTVTAAACVWWPETRVLENGEVRP